MATVPSLPGASTEGPTFQGTRRMVRDSLVALLASKLAAGDKNLRSDPSSKMIGILDGFAERVNVTVPKPRKSRPKRTRSVVSRFFDDVS